MIPGAEKRRVRALRCHAPQHIPGFSAPAGRDLRTQIRPAHPFCGPDDRRRRLCGVHRLRLVAGVATAMDVLGKPMPTLDRLTATGALATYISDHTVAKFQPMNVNFGIIEPLGYKIKGQAGEEHRKSPSGRSSRSKTGRESFNMRIIVDAMGGDNAPESAVWGGALAAKEYGEEVLLVGKPEVVANVLGREGTFRCQGHYHHACKRFSRYARRSRNGTPPQAGFVHGGSVQAAQGRRGRRARFRGQHRRAAHRRNAVRRPHQRASDAVHWHRLCRAQTVRSCCAMRVQTPNAPPKCCSSSRSSLRCMRRR